VKEVFIIKRTGSPNRLDPVIGYYVNRASLCWCEDIETAEQYNLYSEAEQKIKELIRDDFFNSFFAIEKYFIKEK
jgi:hypothetical protein